MKKILLLVFVFTNLLTHAQIITIIDAITRQTIRCCRLFKEPGGIGSYQPERPGFADLFHRC